jgi:putative tryptophan/tyrosine transport system substrate-binding protein
VTGVAVLDVELVPKAFEVLHELAPAVTTIGVLVNPHNPTNEAQTRGARIAARDLGVHLLILNASSQNEIEAEFTRLVEQRVGALLVTGDNFFAGAAARDQIIALAARHAVPTVYPFPLFAVAGGLGSMGPTRSMHFA